MEVIDICMGICADAEIIDYKDECGMCCGMFVQTLMAGP